MKKLLTHFLLIISLNISCQNISSLNPGEETDSFVFDSLKSKLKNKRIICLGETEHRVETFNKLKVELVKYLHENLGYDVVAFEGSMFKISNAFYNIQSAPVALKNSLYGIWQTESVLDLFQYAKKDPSNNPLIFTGFDIKVGPSNSASLWLKNIVQHINPKYAESVYSGDTLFINKTTPFDQQNSLKTISQNESQFFQTFYTSLIDTLNTNSDFILKNNILNEDQLKIIKRSLLNKVYLSVFVTFKEVKDACRYRDSIMTQNILWLIEDLYKDKKIMIWGADAHISKKTIKKYSQFHQKSSIEMLPDNVKNQIETVSLTYMKYAPKAIKNQIKRSKGNAFLISYPDFLNGDFEHIIYFKKVEGINKYKLQH